MRLHVLADLHGEFGPVDIPNTNADVVVLAGDVAVGPRGLDRLHYRFSLCDRGSLDLVREGKVEEVIAYAKGYAADDNW